MHQFRCWYFHLSIIIMIYIVFNNISYYHQIKILFTIFFSLIIFEIFFLRFTPYICSTYFNKRYIEVFIFYLCNIIFFCSIYFVLKFLSCIFLIYCFIFSILSKIFCRKKFCSCLCNIILPLCYYMFVE